MVSKKQDKPSNKRWWVIVTWGTNSGWVFAEGITSHDNALALRDAAIRAKYTDATIVEGLKGEVYCHEDQTTKRFYKAASSKQGREGHEKGHGGRGAKVLGVRGDTRPKPPRASGGMF